MATGVAQSATSPTTTAPPKSMSVSDLKDRVDEITTCSICLGDFEHPHSLPCLHTFCRKCLDDCCKSAMQLQKDQADCPICRKKYNVTDRGADDFPFNFFLGELSEAKKITVASKDGSQRANAAVQCEVCMAETGGTGVFVDASNSQTPAPPATVYCRDCRQKLCERCAAPHRRWRGQPHQVIALGKELEIELVRLRGSQCEIDPDQEVKMFCTKCRTNVCHICYATDHHGHQCRRIDVAAAEIGELIDVDVRSLAAVIDDVVVLRNRITEEQKRFDDDIVKAEKAVIDCGEKLKRIIDERVDHLKLELKEAMSASKKELATRIDHIELALTAMKSYQTYASELRAKGRPCDMTRSGDQLHGRAEELMKTYGVDAMKECDYKAPHVVITTTNIEEFRRSVEKPEDFVARIDFAKCSLVPNQICALTDGDPVWGVASIDDRFYVLRSRIADQIETYEFVAGAKSSTKSGSDSFREVSRMSIPRLRGLADMASCQRNRCLYVVDCVARCVHRIKADGVSATSSGDVTEWPVNDEPWGVSVTPVDGHVLVTCDEAQKLKEFTGDGKLIREVRLPAGIVNPCHAVRLAAPASGRYVVCHGAGSDIVHRVCLVEANGETLRTYGELTPPPHPTPSKSGGAINGKQIADGAVSKQAAPTRQLLDGPRHLAAGKDGFIFVADFNNARVALLSPGFSFVADVVVSVAQAAKTDGKGSSSKRGGLRWNPWRLHLDEKGRRLYVAENEWKDSKWTSGRVVVFEL